MICTSLKTQISHPSVLQQLDINCRTLRWASGQVNMAVGARRAGLSISQTADSLGFSKHHNRLEASNEKMSIPVFAVVVGKDCSGFLFCQSKSSKWWLPVCSHLGTDWPRLIVWTRFRWELFMTDLKSVPSSCLARSFEFCDLQHEQSLQEQLLDDGIWGGGSNFSALHSGAGEPVISYLPLSPLLAAGYNRKGSLPCAILVPLLIIFVLSSNPWH